MKLTRAFIYSSAVALLLTAAAKLITSSGDDGIILTTDPVTGLQFRSLLRVVGIIEIAMALVCIFGKQMWLQASLLSLMSTNFLVYRLGLAWVGWHKPCACLGNLTDTLHIPPNTADAAMKILLAYLIIGSYGTLLWIWWQRCHSLADYPESSQSSQHGSF